ncbi:hypothetical protein AURDEDRAFT_177601 [Auricularia subglabra TFB-10046 SS5]|uniref:Uncharacterized protein n=1 Tax=Auricularia subglabra (strain TFB-10046 / SS5) TaxID=717982 RepID=J0LA88_AURST|nr:hypothetical protein AURDEDRAFT_177601 [Auricularia subglabra TFB-10046 SS5]
MSTRKASQATSMSKSIPGGHITAARKRGGSRSRDPSPAPKRRKVSSSTVGTSLARHPAARAKVVKAAKAPLFLPSDDNFPDDGLDAEEAEDEDNGLSNELVDFITNLGNDDDSDDDEDEDFEPPHLEDVTTSSDEDDDGDDEDENTVQDFEEPEDEGEDTREVVQGTPIILAALPSVMAARGCPPERDGRSWLPSRA